VKSSTRSQRSLIPNWTDADAGHSCTLCAGPVIKAPTKRHLGYLPMNSLMHPNWSATFIRLIRLSPVLNRRNSFSSFSFPSSPAPYTVSFLLTLHSVFHSNKASNNYIVHLFLLTEKRKENQKKKRNPYSLLSSSLTRRPP
jgi:hypothetical protein